VAIAEITVEDFKGGRDVRCIRRKTRIKLGG